MKKLILLILLSLNAYSAFACDLNFNPAHVVGINSKLTDAEIKERKEQFCDRLNVCIAEALNSQDQESEYLEKLYRIGKKRCDMD